MKGHTKIIIEDCDKTGSFPATNTYVISRDNSYEGIEDYVDAFKKILFLVGFHPDTIKEAFNEEL